MTGTEARIARLSRDASARPLETSVPRIVLSGATGRLGRSFAEVASLRGWAIVGAIASPRSTAEGRTLAAAGGGGRATAIRSSDDLAELLAGASVYVACGPASVESIHLPVVADSGLPAVIATTGFNDAEEHELAGLARRIPFVREANFSLGLQWLRSALTGSAPLPDGFDVGLLEAHRLGKRDRPSGTARQIALELGAHGANRRPEVGPSALPVESLRLGELPGIHQVWIAGRSELIRVEHLVLDRRAFAEGIAAAVQWLSMPSTRLSPGEYGLRDVLGIAPEGP